MVSHFLHKTHRSQSPYEEYISTSFFAEQNMIVFLVTVAVMHVHTLD